MDENKDQIKSKFYVLCEWIAEHNHQLDQHDNCDRITDKIKQDIKNLKGRCTDYGELTKEINERYNTKFRTETIHHQGKLLELKEYGEVSEDAHKFSHGLKILHKEKKGIYKELVLNNRLKSMFYMSKRMEDLTLNFCDITYLDATHKSHRFNLPLLDGAVINNLGKTCTSFWSLISDHTYESYYWALKQFKESINIKPLTFIVDEEEALIQGSI